MRALSLCFVALAGLLPAATLEKLSLDDMIQKSGDIVCAKVISSSTLARGPMIYTRYRVQVSQRLKGNAANVTEVVVPGGQNGAFRQTFSGAPVLTPGEEYMLFLWTSKSGLTQVIGLSQGLFDLARDAKGNLMVRRGASTERMLDPANGKAVQDSPLEMRLTEMADRINRTLNQVVQ